MKIGIIRFDREACGNLDASLKREWLETNGLGGFAASTIIGLNTRRYHGLLTAAMKPPVGRLLLLSKLEETLVVGGRRFDLSANRYPGVIHPGGYQYLKEFRLDPFPTFTYQVDGIEIEKRVFMVHGENTTIVEYELRGEGILEVRPLIACRDYHSTTHRNNALNPAVDVTAGRAVVTPYRSLPSLHFAHDASELDLTGHWYENFEYGAEQERGLDYREDLFNPFVARFNGGAATIIASTERRDAAQAAELRRSEVQRRAEVVARSPSAEPLVQALVAAADQFIVKRGDLKTIIAGYHWFSDWGRDTMIAIPGLTLVTGRGEVARSILLAFANSLDRGMLPNRFPEAGETPEYNAVDATLWFFEAIRALVEHTGDVAFVKDHLYDKLKEVIDWHLRGARYGIRVDSDGLLASGESGVQLTWMDAKVGDWVVTPRHGKPVEIQALWYNALRVMEELAREFFDAGPEVFFRELAARARDSFNDLFWNEEAGCLYDVVNGGQRDGSIRPNQVFAVSLAHTMLSDDRARQVISVLERELLTPLGLRSLSPRDPRYRARYEGGVWDRDSSYHQGTVWPWLMGPFITAYVKVSGRSDPARAQAAQWLAAFHEHLRTAGLGQVSEIADADAPHEPRGCVAQAWSVAELLRTAVEDVFATDRVGLPRRANALSVERWQR
ncbi:MAG: amylo-alpha-1,6-glucosidase [Bryobacteraceae bacterium]